MTKISARKAAEAFDKNYVYFLSLVKSGRIPNNLYKRLGEKGRFIFIKEKIEQFLNGDLPYVDPRQGGKRAA